MLLLTIMLTLLPARFLKATFPYDNSIISEVEGLQIHYRHWIAEDDAYKGSVVLIHGFGGSTFSWQAVADSLQKLGFEVVAVDMPPFGYSDKSHRINQSLTAHADRLKSLLDQELPGRKWVMAGHSMGGGVAQAFALSYPNDLQSVTFVAPTLFMGLSKSGEPARNFLRLSPVSYILGEFAGKWFINSSRIESLLSSAYGMPPTDEQVEAYLRPLSVPGTARAILSAASFYQELRTLDASDLALPAVAIWGDADSWVPHTNYTHILEKMPGAALVLMEGVGHNPMETHFDEFMNLWLPFILLE